VEEEIKVAKEVIEVELGPPEMQSEDANIKEVEPEALGFKKNVDVLEKPPQTAAPPREYLEEEMPEEKKKFSLPKIQFARLLSMLPVTGIWPVIGGVVIFVALIAGFLYWALPHATVTIFELPKTLDQSMQITIDPTSTIVDPTQKIIPGKSQERSVSGEKTIPVTGKKNIGDPARGTVTLYNKSLSTKVFKKGTVLRANSLEFTLDAEVSIASASETIGSITFEKQDVAVTASQIGPQSNVSAGTEFTVKDISTSTAAGRNDKALTGGTSKEVTVVTRKDYDSFTTEISEELVDKAKQELATSVGAGEKLVDATVKTSVTEKVFQQELDQEATQLQGKVTISVTGISYSEGDIKEIAKSLMSPTLPTGYSIIDIKTAVTVSDVKVLKNGKITATATISSTALPVIDTNSVKKAISGKNIKSAQEYLRSISGIAGVEFGFRFAPTKSRLPINTNNISISVAIQE
jgi:Baseplate J-like protein